MSKDSPLIKIEDPKDLVSLFIKQFSGIFSLVMGAMLIGFITLLFMVATLLIDAWRWKVEYATNKTSNIEYQQATISAIQEKQASISADLNLIKKRFGIQ